MERKKTFKPQIETTTAVLPNRYKDCRERYIDPHWLLNIK